MPYSQFKTIAQAKAAFQLTVIEGSRFLPETSPVAPSQTLSDYLQETLPIVATSGSEKARSEGIIYPVLWEEIGLTQNCLQVSMRRGTALPCPYSL